MEVVRTVLFAYMETVICDIFVSIFCERKAKWKGTQAVIVWSAYCGIKAFYMLALHDYMTLKIVLGLLTDAVFMVLRFHESIWKIFLCVCGYMSLNMAWDYIFLLLWDNLLTWRLDESDYSVAYVTIITIITKIIEFLLFAWLHKTFSKDRIFGVLDRKGWIRFLMLSGLTIGGLLLLWFDGGYKNVTVLPLSFGLMLINVMFYFTMWDIVNKEHDNQEYRLSQEKIRGQLKLYESIEESYKEQRKRVHEFKNHIGCIQGLLEGENVSEAKEYVERIQTTMSMDDNPVKTGNIIIDIIVNQKYRESLKEQITFVMKLDRLEHFPMQEEDTVILLSNLLDNALEACQKIKNPETRIVKLHLVHKKKKYILVVSNTVEEEVVIKNHVAETTKVDKYQHGIGMNNIREILRKYKADGECKCENGWFTYNIMIDEQA